MPQITADSSENTGHDSARHKSQARQKTTIYVHFQRAQVNTHPAIEARIRSVALHGVSGQIAKMRAIPGTNALGSTTRAEEQTGASTSPAAFQSISLSRLERLGQPTQQLQSAGSFNACARPAASFHLRFPLPGSDKSLPLARN
jgi:hypothetical protein